jgi:type 1 fimbria pilin
MTHVRMRSVAAYMLLLVSTVCMLFSSANADISKVIGYHGKVTDTACSPVPDGVYLSRFFVYDQEMAVSLKWDSGVRLMAVQGGVFSIVLRQSPQPASELAFGQDVWPEVSIGSIQ